MVFTQAISSGFSNYVNFSGRSGRSEYWYWVLFNLLGSIGIVVIGTVLSLMVAEIVGTVLIGLFFVALLIPNFAVMIRRLHDLDKSGWWWLVNFIPFIGALIFLYFMVQPSDEDENRFGMVPEPGIPS